jgi:menaquinone-specific isochorismate synthase
MNPLASSPPSSRVLDPELELDAALARADLRAPLVALTFAAKVAPAEALIAGHEGDAWVFAPASGLECGGIGVVRALEASGPERFEAVQRQAERLFREIETAGGDGESEAPRLFGGFAFQTGGTKSALWSRFGEARFVLPRVSYVRRGQRATLTLTLERREVESRELRRAAAAELVRARELVAEQPPETPRSSPLSVPPVRDDHDAAFAEWSRLVEAIRAAIAEGQFEKVVLARRVELAVAALDPASVLSHLRAQAPECTRFLLRVGASAFVGAAPERLLRKSGRELETEAVAGSIKAGNAGELSRLLESKKDLAEHEMVVRGIKQALAPVSAEIDAPLRPESYKLRHVTHLRTPIRALLNEDRHVLSLVARLHPTPAVGGLPTAPAVDWIAAHERDERGWYAGPIGWFDAAGDGEFAVALRSGVLEQERAHLYVGAGIVRDSRPAEEFAETEWKLAALAGALGVGS